MSTAALDSVGYYGRPIVAEHVWEDTIGWYFFTGGIAGASCVIAMAADLAGKERLAVHARRAAMIGLVPSPALLIADLARPGRFANMLRVFKPTSPMSMGSWLLSVFGPSAAGAWLLGELGGRPRSTTALGVIAGATGALMTTYTAVLVADTATPAWHEARRELPFVFASSAAAAAGATVVGLTRIAGKADPAAATIAVAGALAEAVSGVVMSERLGGLSTYRTDPITRRFDVAATALSVAGAIGLVAGIHRSRTVTLAASASILAGSLFERLAVLRAGTASARDPGSVLLQQQLD